MHACSGEGSALLGIHLANCKFILVLVLIKQGTVPRRTEVRLRFFQYAVLPCVYVRVHVNVDASLKYSRPLVARG